LQQTNICKRGHSTPVEGWYIDEIFIPSTREKRLCDGCRKIYKKRSAIREKMYVTEDTFRYEFLEHELAKLYDEQWLKANGYYGPYANQLTQNT
jgi:uncharacterized protein YqgQ